ncbi:MAG TPA: hypothetical protein VG755_04860, partial [Nannocystaceae bacterium]|nr:hypothetical protein [Nannocystaceae bacterium]
ALGMEVVGGPHRVRTWLRVEASCSDAQTRIMNLQLPGGGGIWYQWAVYTAPGGLELRMRNHASQVENAVVDAAFDIGEWHELELELDVTTTPPSGSLILDGTTVVPELAGPPLSMMALFESVQSLQLGIYRDDAPFPGGCVVYYDDLRVTAL